MIDHIKFFNKYTRENNNNFLLVASALDLALLYALLILSFFSVLKERKKRKDFRSLFKSIITLN